jgi:hypothetical protein
MIRWWRRRPAARVDGRDRVDAWQPGLGVGYWRTGYGECCDMLLAYDRVVATLPEGALRKELAALRGELPAVLDRAWHLAELGATLEPAGPVRDPLLLALLAEDPLGDRSAELPATSPTRRLQAELAGVRDELRHVADEAARLALRLRENPFADDVPTWLDALCDGIAAARRAGWTPPA